jgi:phosphatidylserine decarboxylase
MAVWTTFGGPIDLAEAESAEYDSLQSVFTRRLRAGARPFTADAEALASPCDGIVGAFGQVRDGLALQVKGSAYPIADLLLDSELIDRFVDGWFVTLRLRSTMYHRFHAPADGRVGAIRWIGGDTWNVNPPTLKRVRGLFCRNERVVIPIDTTDPQASIALVAVAAILVSGVELRVLDGPVRQAPAGRVARYPCGAAVKRGDELGHFKNGSTIIVFAPAHFAASDLLAEGAIVRAGEPLLIHRSSSPSTVSPSTGVSRPL